MIAVPVAGEVVAGFSWAALIVARNSTTWARAATARAQNAPAINSPRTGVIFIVVGGEQTGSERIGTHQSVTTWSGLTKPPWTSSAIVHVQARSRRPPGHLL